MSGQDAGSEAAWELLESVRRIMEALDGTADSKEPFERLREIEEGRIGVR